MTAFVLTGCTKNPAPALTEATEDSTVDTTQNEAGEPVTLTMMCNWNETTGKAFADVIHEKFPHITLEYEACPIGAIPYADEITHRVMHDMEADIFLTTDTNLWSSGKLLNFTDEEFVSRYNLSIMKTFSGDGSVYFVPNVGEVLCYIYNAHWLEELDSQPPYCRKGIVWNKSHWMRLLPFAGRWMPKTTIQRNIQIMLRHIQV